MTYEFHLGTIIESLLDIRCPRERIRRLTRALDATHTTIRANDRYRTSVLPMIPGSSTAEVAIERMQRLQAQIGDLLVLEHKRVADAMPLSPILDAAPPGEPDQGTRPRPRVTAKQIREKYGISERTLSRLVREEKLNPSKPGRKTRYFDPDEVEDYLRQNSQKAAVRKTGDAATQSMLHRLRSLA